MYALHTRHALHAHVMTMSARHDNVCIAHGLFELHTRIMTSQASHGLLFFVLAAGVRDLFVGDEQDRAIRSVRERSMRIIGPFRMMTDSQEMCLVARCAPKGPCVAHVPKGPCVVRAPDYTTNVQLHGAHWQQAWLMFCLQKMQACLTKTERLMAQQGA